MTVVANPLPYADLPARWGVSCERTPAGLWVVVPPVPNWRYLIKSHGWVAIPFAIALCSVSMTLIGAPARDWELLWPVGFYSTVFVIVFWHAWYRLRTGTLLRVTHDELTIALVAPTGRCRATSWPRAAVTEVKVNPFSGRLLVRAAGRDMAEFSLSPSARANDGSPTPSGGAPSKANSRRRKAPMHRRTIPSGPRPRARGTPGPPSRP